MAKQLAKKEKRAKQIDLGGKPVPLGIRERGATDPQRIKEPDDGHQRSVLVERYKTVHEAGD